MSGSHGTPSPTIGLAFGRVLRRRRLAQSLTQEALAEHAGLSMNYVYLLEHGRRSPSLDTVEAISAALHVRLSALCAEVEAELSDMRAAAK